MRTVTSALAIVVALTGAAHAQGAEAEVLFREARKLMKQQAFAAACEKFEASERLDATIGTELNLADCREKTGQIASAWAMFVKAAQTAKRSGDKKREAEAQRRAGALEPKLVYLTISVPMPVRIAGLQVHRNDTVLDPAIYDQPIPVDPDTYTITADAPDHQRWQYTITVGKMNKTVEVPRLAVAPAPAPPRAIEPPALPRPSVWTARRKTAAALGAVGVAAGATGIVLGLHAGSLERQSDAICPTVRCNDPTAIGLNQSARSDGLVANLCMIGGGALVAGAAVLWIYGDARPHDVVSILPSIGPSGIALGGRF